MKSHALGCTNSPAYILPPEFMNVHVYFGLGRILRVWLLVEAVQHLNSLGTDDEKDVIRHLWTKWQSTISSPNSINMAS